MPTECDVYPISATLAAVTDLQTNSPFDDVLAVSLPGTQSTLRSLGARAYLDGDSELVVSLPVACLSLHEQLAEALSAVAKQTVRLETSIPRFAVQANRQPLPSVRNVIAVASGKGGVGKSTTAANLALALAAEGASVGVLDADIYGPSMPRMFGLPSKRPHSPDGKTIEAPMAHGIAVMSMGFLVDEHAPMVWRGPMVTQALNQLLGQTRWPDLDFLMVDMPPGTGDIQLTMAQKVPVAGAVIVTTPQDIALTDARKGLEMFRKTSIAVLGIVENMSLYTCPDCGSSASVFGKGGGARLAEDADTTLLGELPLALEIREGADTGNPSVAGEPEGAHAHAYRQIAIRAGVELAQSKRDYSHRFGSVLVEEKQ